MLRRRVLLLQHFDLFMITESLFFHNSILPIIFSFPLIPTLTLHLFHPPLFRIYQDGELTDAMVISLFDEAGAVQGKLLEDQFEDFIDLLADELGLEEQGGEYDNGMTGDDEEETVEDVEVEVQDLVLMDDFASDPSPLPSPATAKVPRRTREQIEEDEMPDDMPADDMNNDFDEELDFGLGSPI